jgi:hypothetical protein
MGFGAFEDPESSTDFAEYGVAYFGDDDDEHRRHVSFFVMGV